MMGLASMQEEILGNTKELAAFNLHVQLFREFSDDGLGRCFTHSHTPPRQRPEVIADELMKKHVVAAQGDGSGTEMELMGSRVKGEHLLP